MSMTVKKRPRLTKAIKATEKKTENLGFLRGFVDLKNTGPVGEAPEEAVRKEEAPESWQECHSEAPDAGGGESLSIERDFTHGRSRS